LLLAAQVERLSEGVVVVLVGLELTQVIRLPLVWLTQSQLVPEGLLHLRQVLLVIVEVFQVGIQMVLEAA
jgi:hypothetical protein